MTTDWHACRLTACLCLLTHYHYVRTADARCIPQPRHVHRVTAEALQVKDVCEEKGGTHNGKHATQSVVRYKVGPPT